VLGGRLCDVHRRGFGGDLAHDAGGAVAGRVVLARARLAVELRLSGGLAFLDVCSGVDSAQGFLLPVSHRPVLAGVSSYTRLGRLHAVYWALAYGIGEIPEVVRFEAATLRYRRSVEVRPDLMGGDCWVAAADGVFGSAALLTAGCETHRVPLADRW